MIRPAQIPFFSHGEEVSVIDAACFWTFLRKNALLSTTLLIELKWSAVPAAKIFPIARFCSLKFKTGRSPQPYKEKTDWAWTKRTSSGSTFTLRNQTLKSYSLYTIVHKGNRQKQKYSKSPFSNPKDGRQFPILENSCEDNIARCRCKFYWCFLFKRWTINLDVRMHQFFTCYWRLFFKEFWQKKRLIYMLWRSPLKLFLFEHFQKTNSWKTIDQKLKRYLSFLEITLGTWNTISFCITASQTLVFHFASEQRNWRRQNILRKISSPCVRISQYLLSQANVTSPTDENCSRHVPTCQNFDHKLYYTN